MKSTLFGSTSSGLDCDICQIAILPLSEVRALASFEASRHEIFHLSSPRHNVSATTKCTMPPIKFIADPSLLRKDSRSRNLLQSAANSHVARYNHKRRRYTNSQRRRYSHGIDLLCLCKSEQPCQIHPDSSVVEVPASLKPRYSEYLVQTYSGSDENSINMLFSYCESNKT